MRLFVLLDKEVPLSDIVKLSEFLRRPGTRHRRITLPTTNQLSPNHQFRLYNASVQPTAMLDELAAQPTPSPSSQESSGAVHTQATPDNAARPKNRKKLA